MADCGASTQEVLIEVSRVKNLLAQELTNYTQQAQLDSLKRQRQQNFQFKNQLTNVQSSIKGMRAEPPVLNAQVQPVTNYANVSSQRLALTNLKQRAKSLEKELRLQQEEIDRLQARTNEKAIDDAKQELRKSYEVMQHLKKKLAGGQTGVQSSEQVNEILA